jgi:hypothetical protein
MSKTQNKLKPLAVFQTYQELIKEYREKHGEIANRVDKNWMYEQVAQRFMISAKYAGQLIRFVMTHQKEFEPYKHDILEVMEALRKVKSPVNKFDPMDACK